MGKLSYHRVAIGLLAWGAGLLLAAAARAQNTPQVHDENYALGNAPYSNAAPARHRPLSPLAPVGFENKVQIFGPADISDYGNGIKPRIGYFFSYERMYWSISKPYTADIGSPAAEKFYNENGILVFEQNSLDTGFLQSTPAWGNRYELGYMDTDDYGWLVGIIHHVSQNQEMVLPGGQVLFNDPSGFLKGFITDDTTFDQPVDADVNGNNVFGRDGRASGDPPVLVPAPIDTGDLVDFLPSFRRLVASQHTELNGVELMKMYRAPRLHNGGNLELLYGVRWFKIDDRFNLLGEGGVLDQFTAENKVENSMVGPQIGVRYASQRGRWIFSTEGRFTAAANFQSVHQKANFATNSPLPSDQNNNTGGTATTQTETRDFPLNLRPLAARNVAYAEEFSPIVELRVQTSYQFTRAFAFKVGYTAMFVDGVSRASNRFAYNLPEMGILPTGTNQNVFINGVSFGFEINR